MTSQSIQWPKVRLGDLFRIKHGFAFKGEGFSDEPGAIVLTPGNFHPSGGIKLRPEKDRSYTGTYPPEFILRPGELLVVMTDLTQEAAILGAPAFVPSDPVCLHNQRLGKVIDLDENRLDQRFLFYLFNGSDYRAEIKATATGSTVRHTSPSRIYDCRVALPPLDTQRRIAGILGAYDDLIEVNRRRVAVLEAMARSCVAEFAAKPAGGLTPAGNRRAASEIVGGWFARDLGDLAEIVMGQSPPGEDLNQEGLGIAFHQGVTEFGALFPSRRVSCAKPHPKKVAEPGDLLFSVRAPVGRINIAAERTALGRGVAAIKPPDYGRHFFTAQLRAIFHTTDLIGNGSIYKAVNRQDIEKVQIVWAEQATIERIERYLRPIYDELFVLHQSNLKLAAARDLLLPRLISGQIDVGTAERQLETAA